MKKLRFHGLGDSADASLLMLQGDRTYSVDANNFFSDGSVSYTVSGYAQYGGAQGIVDTGGNQNVVVTLPSIANVSTITPQQPRIDAVAVIDVTAGTFSGTALFKVYVVGCNNPAFTSNVACLGALSFGAAASQEFPNGFVTAAPSSVGGSRYEIPFTNEQNNVKYEYVALYNVISNSAALTYKAFMAVLPEP